MKRSRKTNQTKIPAPVLIVGCHSNPLFNKILEFKAKLHDVKGHDYAGEVNPFFNFEFAASYAGIEVNQQFDALVGTKIARLIILKTGNKKAKNEKIEETERDLSMYIDLKHSYGLKS